MRTIPVFQIEGRAVWIKMKESTGLWALANDPKDARYYIRRLQVRGIRRIMRYIKQDQYI